MPKQQFTEAFKATSQYKTHQIVYDYWLSRFEDGEPRQFDTWLLQDLRRVYCIHVFRGWLAESGIYTQTENDEWMSTDGPGFLSLPDSQDGVPQSLRIDFEYDNLELVVTSVSVEQFNSHDYTSSIVADLPHDEQARDKLFPARLPLLFPVPSGDFFLETATE